MKLGTAMLNGRPTLVAAMEDGLVELRSPALPETLLGVLQAGEAALVECARLVALAARIFGKPQDADEALAMLAELSGRVHQVLTAVALADHGAVDLRVSVSQVRFRQIGESELRAYAASGAALPVVDSVLRDYAQLIAEGHGDEDISAIFRLTERLFD